MPALISLAVSSSSRMRSACAPRRMSLREEDARLPSGVVAHVGEHAGAPTRGLGWPQVPSKKGPNDQHDRHGGRQVLGVEILQVCSSHQGSMSIWHAG